MDSQSGVGKSSLINAVFRVNNLTVGALLPLISHYSIVMDAIENLR
jgi:predicted GTPase